MVELEDVHETKEEVLPLISRAKPEMMGRAGEEIEPSPPTLTTTHTFGEVHAMANANHITPFPADEDRTRFGDWLSGFVDGEGCFSLTKMIDKHGYETRFARFAIALRSDDGQILQKIQSFLMCGSIFPRKGYGTSNPAMIFAVSNTSQLTNFVVPHFDSHPLQAKKRNDFLIWKQAVMLLHCVCSRRHHRKWTSQEMVAFDAIVDALKNQRQFEAPDPLIETREPEPSLQSMLF